MFGAFDRGLWCTSPCHVRHGDYVVQVKAGRATPHLFLLNSSQKWEFWPIFPLFLGIVLPSSAEEWKFISREGLGLVWASFWILFHLSANGGVIWSSLSAQLSLCAPSSLQMVTRWMTLSSSGKGMTLLSRGWRCWSCPSSPSSSRGWSAGKWSSPLVSLCWRGAWDGQIPPVQLV